MPKIKSIDRRVTDALRRIDEKNAFLFVEQRTRKGGVFKPDEDGPRLIGQVDRETVEALLEEGLVYVRSHTQKTARLEITDDGRSFLRHRLKERTRRAKGREQREAA